MNLLAGAGLIWLFIWCWTILDMMDAKGTGEIRFLKRRKNERKKI